MDQPIHPVRGARERKIARANKAVELRCSGYSYPQIANALGFKDRRGAHNAVVRTLRRTSAAHVEEWRQIELRRTERLIQSVWPQALAGDLFAVDRVLKIIDRQCRLLGLNALVQVAITERTRNGLANAIADFEWQILPLPTQSLHADRGCN